MVRLVSDDGRSTLCDLRVVFLYGWQLTGFCSTAGCLDTAILGFRAESAAHESTEEPCVTGRKAKLLCSEKTKPLLKLIK